MDIDAVEKSYFTIYTTDGSSVKKDIVGLGDNSIQEETIAMEDVRRITLTVSNSAGVRYVEFCRDEPTSSSPPSPAPTLAPSPLPAGPFVYFRSATWADASNPCSHPDECKELIHLGDDHWMTHRFEVKESSGLVVTSVGGTFQTEDKEVLGVFAAISRLESATAYPNYASWRSSNSFYEKDLIAVKKFTIPPYTDPHTTSEFNIPLSTKLEQGWYALTFGRNLLGVEPVVTGHFALPLSMVILPLDLTYEQEYLSVDVERDFEILDYVYSDEPLFMVKGLFPSLGCYVSLQLVDAEGKRATGWLGTNLIGLDWFYRSNGSYEMSFVANISGDCPDIGSVRLELTSEDGTDDHSQCERVPPYTLFGDDTMGTVFTFTPTFGDKSIVATAFTGTECQPESAVNVDFLNVEFWWTTYWHTPSSWDTSDILQILLIGNEGETELCQLSEHFTINLAKLPKNLAIETRFKHGFDPENPDRSLGIKFVLDGKDYPIQESQPFVVDVSNVGRTDTAVGGYPPLPPHFLEISVIEVKGGTEFFKGKYSFFVVQDTSLDTPACSNGI